MKRNIYYQTMFKRQNLIKEFFLNFFLSIASYPRLILEVFIRKNMGRRYFRASSAISVAIILFIIPLLVPLIASLFRPYGNQFEFSELLKGNWLWYTFIVVFLGFSYLRYKDVKFLKAQFDFNHFSLSSGDVLPFFYQIKYKGKPFSIRTIEIFIEPLLFLIIGIILVLIDQKAVGFLFVICSGIYSLSYSGAYMRGDNFILDKIDEHISGEELSRTFVSDEEPKRGFRFYGEKPSSQEMREEFIDYILVDDDEITDAE